LSSRISWIPQATVPEDDDPRVELDSVVEVVEEVPVWVALAALVTPSDVAGSEVAPDAVAPVPDPVDSEASEVPDAT
jgi:hypothetical protein